MNIFSTKIYQAFRFILFLIIPIYLNSCASSSYYERYGNQTEYPKENTTSSSTDLVVEDETEDPLIKVSNTEADQIIDKLSNVTNSNSKKERFLLEIVSYLNTPYRYGGESRNGIDCSAFTQNVYKNSLNIKIPRTAREQFKTWETFEDKNELKFGDLIYFDTSKKYFPGHVGIYLDDNLFAHASSSSGVIVSSLENNYYSNKYIGANRVKL